MQLVNVAEQILETGVLPMAIERQLHKLLATQELIDATEILVIEKLIYSLMNGAVKPVA